MDRIYSLVVAIVIATVSASACSGSNPTAPTPSVPTPTPGVTASTASLSPDAKAQLATVTMSSVVIQRWADRTTPIRVFSGPYSGDSVLQGANYWTQTTGFRFELAKSEGEADIRIQLATESDISAYACGKASLIAELPVIRGGVISLLLGTGKSGCGVEGIIATAAHEVGHILGFNHTQQVGSNRDIMDGLSLQVDLPRSPVLDDLTRWVHSHQPGTKVVG